MSTSGSQLPSGMTIPQSSGQVWQVSNGSQSPSKSHPVGHGPQSRSQSMHDSPAAQTPSPQDEHGGSSQGQTWQSMAQLLQFSPAAGSQMPLLHSGPAPSQSCGQSPGVSPPEHTPLPQSGGPQSPEDTGNPQSLVQLRQSSPAWQMLSPQYGPEHGLQSEGQLEHVSPASQMSFGQRGWQFPQSAGHVPQLSEPTQASSPQNSITGQVPSGSGSPQSALQSKQSSQD